MPFVIEKSGSALICQPEGLVNSANAAVFEADLMAMIADNPCGNGTQLTPMVLIREVKD